MDYSAFIEKVEEAMRTETGIEEMTLEHLRQQILRNMTEMEYFTQNDAPFLRETYKKSIQQYLSRMKKILERNHLSESSGSSSDGSSDALSGSS
jgi:hypothetical protein